MVALGTSVASKIGKVRADQAEKSVASIEKYAERINALLEFVQSAQASLIDETASAAAAAGPTQICEAMSDVQELTARIAKETAKCHDVLKQLSGTQSEMDISAECLRHKSHAIAEQAYHLDQALAEFSSHMRKAHHESQRLRSASSPISTLVDDLALASVPQRSILSTIGAKGLSGFATRPEVSSFVTPLTSHDERIVIFPTRGRRSERS
jgi:myosin heavy subunit